MFLKTDCKPNHSKKLVKTIFFLTKSVIFKDILSFSLISEVKQNKYFVFFCIGCIFNSEQISLHIFGVTLSKHYRI